MTVLLSATIKVTLLVAAALGLTAFLHRRSAALRHWILATALIGSLALPLMELAAPTWTLPLPVLRSAPNGIDSVRLTSNRMPDAGAPAVDALPSTAPADTTGISLAAALAWLWAAGAIASLAVIGAGLLRVRRLAAAAAPLDVERWLDAAQDVSREYRIHRHVTLLHSAHPAMVVTWGARHPKILVPKAAPGWTDDRLHAVLRHELAHVRRGDWVVMLLAVTVRALYWFNPLVWLAVRQLRHESERACDDLVLSSVAAPDYATHLLEVARETAQARQAVAPAIALTHPSTLEGRIRAMLNTELDRQPITSAGRFIIIALALAVLVPMGGAQLAARAEAGGESVTAIGAAPATAERTTLGEPPAAAGQLRPATIEGTLYDQFGGLLPGASVTLTHASTGGRYNTVTDPGGSFTFSALPSGDYQLVTSLPGFAPVTNELRLTDGASIRRHITLPLGSLEETIMVVCDTAAAASAQDGLASPSARDTEPRVPALFSGGIGGQIRVPRKVVNVNPACPRDGRIGHTMVRLGGRVGIDGLLSDLHDVTPPARRASVYLASAVEAVRQWEFTPTLLNGSPVEANIVITVNFTTAQ